MAEETKTPKWEGKGSVELKNIKSAQVWPLLEDFCNLHKWHPIIDTCTHVEGAYGQPGLVRYCATNIQASPSSNDADQTPATVVKWCHEKLLSIDPVQRCLSYKIGENNLGFTGYVAEMKVVEIDDGGCAVEWSFTADLVDGMTSEDLSGYMESSLKVMAEKVKDFYVATNES